MLSPKYCTCYTHGKHHGNDTFQNSYLIEHNTTKMFVSAIPHLKRNSERLLHPIQLEKGLPNLPTATEPRGTVMNLSIQKNQQTQTAQA